jgi:hypothetical protein
MARISAVLIAWFFAAMGDRVYRRGMAGASTAAWFAGCPDHVRRAVALDVRGHIPGALQVDVGPLRVLSL